MSDNVQSATLEVLKRIQEKLGEHDERFDQIDKRLDRFEELMRKNRRDIAGMLVMMKATAGDFDGRMTALVARFDALETRPS